MNNSNKPKPFALLVNDLHVGKDNWQDFDLNWAEAMGICTSRGIPRILVGGDLFLSRAAQTLEVLLAVRDALLDSFDESIEVSIIEGNHDKVNQEDYLGYCHVFSEYPNVNVGSPEIAFRMSGANIIMLGYFPENTTFEQELERVVEKHGFAPENTILYIHEGISGAIATNTEKELPASLFQGFKKVLVGHYHDRCQIKGTNIEYIGASRQHNYGEDEEKGYTILYTDGSTEFVKNKANQKYKTVEVDVQGLKDMELAIADLQSQGYKLKLKVNVTNEDSKLVDRQKLADMGVSKVEIITRTDVLESHSHDFEPKYNKDGLKKEYAEYCKQKEISDVETGIRYLDKIS